MERHSFMPGEETLKELHICGIHGIGPRDENGECVACKVNTQEVGQKMPEDVYKKYAEDMRKNADETLRMQQEVDSADQRTEKEKIKNLPHGYEIHDYDSVAAEWHEDGFAFREPVSPFLPKELYHADKVVKQVSCYKCGATELEVGSANHLTMIRCPKCKHETIIAEG